MATPESYDIISYGCENLTLSEAQTEKIWIIQDPTKVERLLTSDQSVSILFAGKTGVGKSSLINGLVGREIAKEGAGHDSTTPLRALDQPYRQIKQMEQGGEIKVKVWDSPGLQDARHRKDTSHLSKLHDVSAEANLLVYCISMSEPIDRAAKNALRDFARKCPKEIWRRAVIALTRANQITYPSDCTSDEAEVTFFQETVCGYVDAITEILQESGVEEEVYKHLPMVPTGYYRKPARSGNDFNPWQLPGCKHWMQPYWYACLFQCQSAAAQAAIFLFNIDRFSNSQDIILYDKPIYQQPLFYDRECQELVKNGVYMLCAPDPLPPVPDIDLQLPPPPDIDPAPQPCQQVQISSWYVELYWCIREFFKRIIFGAV